MHISTVTWDMKYRLKDLDGTIRDDTVEATWRRVARALAEPEKTEDRQHWEMKFYDNMSGYKNLPAGRILAGAGTGRKVTLFNCYVMGTIPDSMPGIFQSVKEAALTQQQGGGIGMDFSTLRFEGAEVVRVGSTASGPLSFMDVWDTMCKTIMSAGSRRGAMMATLRCDHPDIEKFIEAKRDKTRFRNFNLSVLVTEPFMDAVKLDKEWDLLWKGKVIKTVQARALWDQIMQATYDVADPGVIFIDRINQLNNLSYCETIAATNPCGEQPLPPYGACLLGSVNLFALVKDPFTPNAYISNADLEEVTATAIRMMDNVIDVSNFPLPQQENEAKSKRRLGLGITGLADALVTCGLKYNTEEARKTAAGWMKRIRDCAYLTSANLAKEKGPFPEFKLEYCDSPNIRDLPDVVQQTIREHGIRNSHLTSIAPTGTISLFAGNISSGVEPAFAFEYQRKMLQPDGTTKTEDTVDAAVQLWRDLNGNKPLPDTFITANELTPTEHLLMQAELQKYIDTSISKTINCPVDISFEDFKNIYMEAYDLGCKGCTTYRPNPTTGSILSTKEEPKADILNSRPESLPGITYKLKFGGDQEHATYITITDILDEKGIRRPYEMFINSKNMEHYAWVVAMTRMISAVFRKGGDVSFVVEELKSVFDPRGGHFHKGKYVPSLIAAIGDVLETHMRDIGFLEPLADKPEIVPTSIKGSPCPKCYEFSVVKQEGCEKCLSCDYSKCG